MRQVPAGESNPYNTGTPEEAIVQLVLNVIKRAARDVKIAKEREDALRFFDSEAYRIYLDLLGVPEDWLPAGVEKEIRRWRNAPSKR